MVRLKDATLRDKADNVGKEVCKHFRHRKSKKAAIIDNTEQVLQLLTKFYR